MSSNRKVSRITSRRSWLRALRCAASFRAEPNRSQPTGPCISQWDDDPADVRKALLPGRVLNHHRDDVPPMLDRREPELGRRDREEVRDDEDEGTGGDRTGVRGEVIDRPLEPIRRASVFRRPQPLVANLDQLALPLRLPPVRVAVRVVEIADEAAGCPCAREHELDDRTHRRGLVQPGQRRPVARHLGPSVADDHDLRRLFGEALTDDELVGPARGGEPRRRRPVDRVHVVAQPVRTRARDVRSGSSTKALHRPERQADDAAARNEREGEARARQRRRLRRGVRLPDPALEERILLRTRSGRELEAAFDETPRPPPTQPVARARATNAGVKTTRWTSTGEKSRSMSSGTTKLRPSSRAHALAARSSARLPRTELPMTTDSCSRVARTSSTTHRCRTASTYTCCAAARSSCTSSRPTTGRSSSSGCT